MSNHPIPLEDDPCDVIAKAMRGLNISSAQLAKAANLNQADIHAALRGQHSCDTLQKIALPLKLSPIALANLPNITPKLTPPSGFHIFTSPFGHAGVNAFAITHHQSAILFDTGTNAANILSFLQTHNLTPQALYITHNHPDHTAAIDDFPDVPIVYPGEIQHGDTLSHQGFQPITALDVSGHASPAKAYFYQSLEIPVCMVGDSIFAGSMGGTSSPQAYQQALQTARNHIMSLPENTIIAPGHGPLSSVAHEQACNPFLGSS